LRDVKVDVPSTPLLTTQSTSSAKTPPVDIEKPSHLATVSPADCDCDRVAVGGQSRQSYASVVSTRRDGPHDRAVDSVELPCPGE